MSNKNLILLCGGSGAGKDTVCETLINKYGYGHIITYTTRSPRRNETQGKEHHFISEADFARLQYNKAFTEETIYRLHKYGTLERDIIEAKNKILILDAESCVNVKMKYPDTTLLVYISANDNVRFDRLCKRGDNPQNIALAMVDDAPRIERIYGYSDVIIENDGSLEDLEEKVYKQIIKGE